MSRSAALVTALVTALAALAGGDDAERGDVPGWVLVTVMTAGIVVALAAVAGPMLTEMFTAAVSAVTVP